MTSLFETIEKLPGAIKSFQNKVKEVSNRYISINAFYASKKHELSKKQKQVKKLKKLLSIQKLSIASLNEIAKLYEKYSIINRLEKIITDVVKILFARSDIKIVFNKETKRNQQELYIYKVEKTHDREHLVPIKNTGGGLSDIVDIIIRILVIQQFPKHQRTLLLDEPMKNLSQDLRPKFFAFLKSLCKQMDIQLLFVTHESEYINEADKIITVTHNGKESIIK